MSELDIFNPSMLGVIFTFVIGLIASSQKWLTAKSKLKNVREFLEEIEIASEDNVITPEETKRIFASAKRLAK
jgi:hypothetical protein